MQEPELTARIAQATRDACEAIRTRGPEDYRPSRIPGQRSLRTGSPS